MSDARVLVAIEQMEAWLAEPLWAPTPESLALWHVEFQAALSEAEKAQGWAELIARAHSAGRLLEVRSNAVAADLERLRSERASQGLGDRALKGYGAGLR